tara:strand:- start:463 stop:669 length:207 start_codon:yes stop_codon:yes gene_type:complete
MMSKYYWIIRTDDTNGLPYDTFIKWYNLPTLIYWLIQYRIVNYWCSFTWIDMDTNIGESDLFILRGRR